MKNGMEVFKDVLETFKVATIVPAQKSSTPCLELIDRGVVLDFVPTKEQIRLLKKYIKPIEVITLFSKKERETSNVYDLIEKQILHYLEVYGLDSPGLFELETSEGEKYSLTFIKGVSTVELKALVDELLYTNAPIKDSNTIKSIIEDYQIDFEVNKIKNNELRVLLFDPLKDVFENGDDAVRYMCYAATQSALLIKSREVIEAVETTLYPTKFFEMHVEKLAEVFNRHKKIILAAKDKNTKKHINKISKLSKKKHIPIPENPVKLFISKAVKDLDFSGLEKATVRDKFKYLNLLEFKKLNLDVDSFQIRNGKVYFGENRKLIPLNTIKYVEKMVLESLNNDLNHLFDKEILLDENVDYGLPISRKQVVGNLPFGSTVEIDKGKISSGIYWENNWGARDLDLSTVDNEGRRIGWGSFSAYTNQRIRFSGDITDARDGAMEFMVSDKETYGLFVNIYSGEVGCGCEVVVGKSGRNKWIKDIVIREKVNLNSRGMVIGFVKNTKYVAYMGRLNERAANFGERNPIINKGLMNHWTVKRLFDELGIQYKYTETGNGEHDLTYKGFTYDKLEKLLLK